MGTMLKSLSCAAVALAVFAIGPASAERAEQDNWSRRVVGVPTPSFDSNAPVQNNGVNLWFGQQGNANQYPAQGNRDFFNYFFNNAPRTQSSRNQDFNVEPEIDSSSNVPIYDYAADPMVMLGRSDLKRQAVPSGPVFSAANADGPNQGVRMLAEQRAHDDPLASSLYDHLRQSASGVRVTKAQNAAITEFYAARNFKPLWTTADGLTPGAKELLDMFSRADEDGLVAADYLPPALAGFDGALNGEDGPGALADAELGITAMAVRYAQHASGGRIAPNRLSGYFDLNPPKIDAKVALDKLAASKAPAAYLQALQPRHPAYAVLKKELQNLLDEPDTPIVNLTVEDGPTIRPGESDARIPIIRTRLMKLGHLETTIEAASDTPAVEPIVSTSDDLQVRVITVDGITQVDVAQAEPQIVTVSPDGDSVYDPLLEKALKAFQHSAGLRADGLIGSRTVAALNEGLETNTRPVRKQKIRIAMERLRWLPRDLGSRYVFANQAAFEVYVMDSGRQIWQSKVIVGKRQNQTAEFVDEMETVVFNPYWGVPQSIIVKEMLPYLRQDPSYLDRNGYEVTNDSGRRIASSSVDWWQFGDAVPLNVRQPPGSDNALGEVKFLFPNSHSIYMHDTPSKPLFNKPSRAFSHGCVRVQNPRQFAEVLLRWPASEVAAAIEDRQNKEVKLPAKVPVYLTYFTAWPDARGNVQYYDDVYGRDELMQTAAATTDRALHASQ